MDFKEPSHKSETPPPSIVLKEEWRALIETFHYTSDIMALPTPHQSVRLQLGAQCLYISRNDIFDKEGSRYRAVPQQVARLMIAEGNIIGIKVDKQELLADTFAKLSPDPFFQSVIEKFGIDTTVSPATAQRIQAFAGESRKNVAQKMQLKAWFQIQALEVKQRRSLPLSGIEGISVMVHMGRISSVDPDSHERYVTTLGAEPCLIAAGYNAESHTAAITHMDAYTDMEQMVQRLCKRLNSRSIRILGGTLSSLNKLISLKEILDRNQIIVEEWDVLNSPKSIAIDKETGEFFDVIGKE